MAEPLLAGPRAKVPHHGPVTPECPVEYLPTVLSLESFNPLARAYDAPFDEPRTVGDVMDLYTRRQLRKIRGIGSRRISEGLPEARTAGTDDLTYGPETLEAEVRREDLMGRRCARSPRTRLGGRPTTERADKARRTR
jgi:hypothetical protein